MNFLFFSLKSKTKHVSLSLLLKLAVSVSLLMILAFRDHCLSGRKTNTKINLIEVENYSALNLTSNHITNLAMDKSKIPKNCFSEVWYITFTILISTIKKYRMEPRVATGRNSSRAKLILTSVSAATASFSLTSSAVSLVVFSTATRDSSSTNEPYGKKNCQIK